MIDYLFLSFPLQQSLDRIEHSFLQVLLKLSSLLLHHIRTHHVLIQLIQDRLQILLHLNQLVGIDYFHLHRLGVSHYLHQLVGSLILELMYSQLLKEM